MKEIFTFRCLYPFTYVSSYLLLLYMKLERRLFVCQHYWRHGARVAASTSLSTELSLLKMKAASLENV